MSWFKLAEMKTAMSGVEHVVVEKLHGISIMTKTMAGFTKARIIKEAEYYAEAGEKIKAPGPETLGQTQGGNQGRGFYRGPDADLDADGA